MRIFCDFDGTITKLDVTDHMLARFADPSWERIEADWQAGRITAAACMRSQVSLINASDAALDAALDAIELDEGFVDFASWGEARRIPVIVVSDGVDYFIRRILARHGLGHLPLISNRLAGDALQRSLEQPWSKAGCAAGSGVCKCAVLASDTGHGPSVFVGDGRSDFCASARADILFAKSHLARYAATRGQPHHPFETFHDVRDRLAAMLGEQDAVAV